MPPEAKLKFEEVTRSLLTHIQFIRSESISSLRHSIRVAERESFSLAASCARIRCGRLLGGDEGQSLVTSGELWMKGQEIAAPDRMIEVIAPGFHH